MPQNGQAIIDPDEVSQQGANTAPEDQSSDSSLSPGGEAASVATAVPLPSELQQGSAMPKTPFSPTSAPAAPAVANPAASSAPAAVPAQVARPAVPAAQPTGNSGQLPSQPDPTQQTPNAAPPVVPRRSPVSQAMPLPRNEAEDFTGEPQVTASAAPMPIQDGFDPRIEQFGALSDPAAVNEFNRRQSAWDNEQQRIAQAQAKAAQKANFDAANDAYQQAAMQAGAVTYREAGTGIIRQAVDDQGRPLYKTTPFVRPDDPNLAPGIVQRRNQYGQVEQQMAPMTAAKDPSDPNLYYKYPDGSTQVAGHVDDLALSSDPAVAAQAKKWQAVREKAIIAAGGQPLVDAVGNAKLAVVVAKQQLGDITAKSQQLAAQLQQIESSPDWGKTQGGFLGFGEKPTDAAQQLKTKHDLIQKQLDDTLAKQDDLTRQLGDKAGSEGSLYQAQQRAELDLQTYKLGEQQTKWGDAAQRRAAILQQEGRNPEKDEVYQKLVATERQFGENLSQVASQRDAMAKASAQRADAVRAQMAKASDASTHAQVDALYKERTQLDADTKQFQADADAFQKQQGAGAFKSPQDEQQAVDQLNARRAELIQRSASLDGAESALGPMVMDEKRKAYLQARRDLQDGEELYGLVKSGAANPAPVPTLMGQPITGGGELFGQKLKAPEPVADPVRTAARARLLQLQKSPAALEAAKAVAFSKGDTSYSKDEYAKLPNGGGIVLNPGILQLPKPGEAHQDFRAALEQAAKKGDITQDQQLQMTAQVEGQLKAAHDAAVDGAIQSDAFARWVAANKPALATSSWNPMRLANFKVPENSPELKEAADEFLRTTPTGMDQFHNALSELGTGIGQNIGTVAEIGSNLSNAVANLVRRNPKEADNPLTEFAEGVKIIASQKNDPRLADAATTQVANTVGNIGAFAIGLGEVKSIAETAKLSAPVAKLLAFSTEGSIFAQQGADQAREDAIAHGMTKEQADAVAPLGAIVGAATVPLTPLMGWAARMNKAGEALTVQRAVQNLIRDTAMGTGAMTLNQAGLNLVAKETYDKDRSVWEGTGKAAADMGAASALIGMISGVMGVRNYNRYTKGQLDALASLPKVRQQLWDAYGKVASDAANTMAVKTAQQPVLFDAMANRAAAQSDLDSELAKPSPDMDKVLSLRDQVIAAEKLAIQAIAKTGLRVAKAKMAEQEIAAMPDYKVPDRIGNGGKTTPVQVDPNTGRDAASALLKVQAGTRLADLTAQEQKALDAVSKFEFSDDAGSIPMVRAEKGGDVITDKAAGWLRRQSPAAADLIEQTESQHLAETRDELTKIDEQGKEIKEPSPSVFAWLFKGAKTARKSADREVTNAGDSVLAKEEGDGVQKKTGLNVSFTDAAGRRQERAVPADAKLSTGETVTTDDHAAQWLAENGVDGVRDVSVTKPRGAPVETGGAGQSSQSPVAARDNQQPETPKTREAGPATEKPVEHVKADALRAAIDRSLEAFKKSNPGRDLSQFTEQRRDEAAKRVSDAVNKSIHDYRHVFSDGVEVHEGADGSGGVQIRGGRLHVHLGDLADHKNLGPILRNEGRAAKLVQEEAIHKVALQLFPERAGIEDIWNGIGAETQAAIRAAYERGGARATDFQLGHELLRMIVQGRLRMEDGRFAFDGKLSEDTVSKNVLERIRDVLARIYEYFRETAARLRRDGASESAAKATEDAATAIEQRLREFMGIGEKTDGPGSPAAPARPVPPEGEKIDREWMAFSPESKSLGIPRADMPQVKSDARGALTQFLKARGVTHTEEMARPSSLKPTQAEYSREKVDKARAFEGGDRAILVSSDNHVVDGHHQWMADLADAPDEPIRVIRLNAPIRDLLPLVHEFPSTRTVRGEKPSTVRTGGAAEGETGPSAQIEAYPNGMLTDESRKALAQEIGVTPGQVGGLEKVTHKGRSYMVANVVIDANSAATSHDYTGAVNEGYPQELQPRNRTDKFYRQQQAKIAGNPNLDEEAKVGSPDSGPPIMAIVGGRPVTIIGNGRANAKHLMYAEPDFADAARAYPEKLATVASRRGISAETVRSVGNPVLARVIVTPMSMADLREVSKESNQFSGAETNAIEQAAADADALTPGVLANYDPSFDLMAGRNAAFRAEFVRAAFGEQGANLTEREVERRLQLALFAKAYGNTPEGQAAFLRLAGEHDDSTRNLTNAMFALAPELAAMKQQIAAGALHDLDISGDIARAAQNIGIALRDRPSGRTVDAALEGLVSQEEINLGGADPMAKSITEFLVRNRRSRVAIEEGLKNYVASVYAAGDPKQAGLFGDETPSREKLWKAVEEFTPALASSRAGAVDALKSAVAGEDRDARILAEFSDWAHGFTMGIPDLPKTLPTDSPLLVNTQTKPTVVVRDDSPIVGAGIMTPGTYPRGEMRAAIINHFLGMQEFNPDGRPHAILMGGGGGSGKSTLAHQIHPMGDWRGVRVDADEVKALIPEFAEITRAGDGRAAATVHEESSDIAKRVRGVAMGRKNNLFYDATMANKASGIEFIAALKKAGYDVKMNILTVDPYEALVRAVIRAKEKGRWVPRMDLLEAHRGVNRALGDYIRFLGKDHVRVFDSSGENPKEVPVDDVLGGRYGPIRERSDLNPHAKRREDLYHPAGAVQPGGDGSDGQEHGEGEGDYFAPDGRRGNPGVGEMEQGERSGMVGRGGSASGGVLRPDDTGEGILRRGRAGDMDSLSSGRGSDGGTLDFFSELGAGAEAKNYVEKLPAAAKKSRSALKAEVARDIPALAGNGAALGDLFAFAQEQDRPNPIEATSVEKSPNVELVAPVTAKGRESAGMAGEIANRLADGRALDWKELFAIADKHFGGTQAEGRYTVKDAYDAMELGINDYIRAQGITPAATPQEAFRAVAKLKAMLQLVPTQTKRTAETDEYQQFSTVPPLAYLANWAANVGPGDTYLEPSGGVGGMAVFGQTAGAKVYVNEFSERRADLLRALGGFAGISTENAEHLNSVLPDAVRPTVVVMNPPFSSTAGRMQGVRDTANAGTHLEQALKRLRPGGRLVAILGEGMAADRPAFRAWWDKIQKTYNVRANVQVSGQEYAKYGTTWDNQIVVVDADGPTRYGPLTGRVEKVEGLIPLLNSIRNERPQSSPALPGEPGGDRSTQPARGSKWDQPEGARSSVGGSGEVPANGARGGREWATTQQRGVGEADHGGAALERSNGAGGELAGGPRPVDGRGGELSGVGEAAGGNPAGLLGGNGSEAVDYRAGETKADGALTDKTYDAYKPRILVPGATMPPVKLDESAAMASVEPVRPTYRLAIPRRFIEPQDGAREGRLSAVALESIILAGNAHQDFIPAAHTEDEAKDHQKRFGEAPPEKYRRGFFIGDGTGAGKGRQAFGIILDNWMQGRRRAVWVSEKPGLVKDARRDARDVADLGDKIFEVRKIKAGEKIPHTEGVGFISYSTLRSVEQKPGSGTVPRSRVDQIVDWLGSDFDGPVLFDESHNMANNTPMKGKRGKTLPSAQALAGVELQRRLPNARVVYLSATGATEVANLGYADRLGLWGPGTPFANKRDFMAQVSAGGVAAMELVARDMKAMGLYLARSLSWDGVTYDRLEHPLEDHQREVYDTLAESWQGVLKNMDEALRVIGAVSSDAETGKDKTLNKDAKSAMRSAFWGAHQRFFNQVITSMKMPTVVDAIKGHLKDGKAVVVQLVNTNQASMERALAKNAETDGDLEDLDMSPRDQLIQLVEKSFPVIQQEQYTDSDENVRSRPALDSAGNPIINKEAVAMREALIDRLASIRVPDGPLEILLNELGKDNVAEVTGRTRRLVFGKDKDGNTVRMVEARGEAQRDVEAQEFMDDNRRTLVFSQAGGTGRSYHADLNAKNQRPRVHVLLQPGWQASQAVQGFGRTHRNNQKQPPHYQLAMTDIAGEKRFMSSIARRLDQLGALTKGQRETGSSGIFKASDNLESQQAKDALQGLYRDVLANAVPGLSAEKFTKEMGLKLTDDNGQMLQDTPPITQFLNRLLSLKLDTQRKVFDEFSDRIERATESAIANGTLDTGMENLKALHTRVENEQVIHRDARTGAETKHVELSLEQPTDRRPWSDVNPANQIWLNKNTGKVWEAKGESSRTTSDGRVVGEMRLDGISGRTRVPILRMQDPEAWQQVKGDEARDLWRSNHDAVPTTRLEKVNLLTGTLLNVWDRLPPSTARVVRVQTDDGRRMIGRVIPNDQIGEVLSNFGVAANARGDFDAGEAANAVMERGAVARLANGWRLKRSLVSGQGRLELIGPELKNTGEMDALGIQRERIAYAMRYFVPLNARLPETLAKLTENRPVVEVGEKADPLKSGAAADGQDNFEDIFGEEETPAVRVAKNLGLATTIAARYFTPANISDHGDIIQTARVGLIKAAKAFDPARGIPFSGFAGQVIRNELNDRYGAEKRRAQREAVSLDQPDEDGGTLGDSFAAPAVNHAAGLEREETARAVRAAIASLGDGPRRLVEDRLAGKTLEAIAAERGVSKQAIHKSLAAALMAMKGRLAQMGIRGIDPEEAVVMSSSAESDDEDAIRELMEALGGKMVDGDAFDQNMQQADIEAGTGKKTVGRPDLANPGMAEDARQMMNAVDETRKLAAEKQTHDQWRQQAVEMLKKDRDGVKRRLLEVAQDSQFHGLSSAVDVKAAQMLVNDLMQRAMTSRDPEAMREAQILSYAYREGGTEQARAMAARRDPFKSPEDRHREFLASVLFRPAAEVRRQIDKAPTPAGKSRLVDGLKKQIRQAEGSSDAGSPALRAKIAELKVQLGRAAQQRDKTQILFDANAQRLEKIEKALAGMGVTLGDLFQGEAYLRLRGAKVLDNYAAKLDDRRKQAFRLLRRGKTWGEVSKATGLRDSDVDQVFSDFRAEFVRKNLAKFEAGMKAEDVDVNALSAAPAAGAKISREQAMAEMEKALAMMGFAKDQKERNQLRKSNLGRSVQGRKRERELDRMPQGAAPGKVEFPKDATGKPKPDAGNRQTELGEDANAVPPGADLPATGGPSGTLENDAANANAVPPPVDLADPVQVARLARVMQAADGNAFDMAYEYWINAILSGPLTHAANFSGMAAAAGWDMTIQRGMEAMLNAGLTAAGKGDAAAPRFGEFQYLARGMVPGFQRGLRNAINAFNAEASMFNRDVLDQQIDLGMGKLDGHKVAIGGRKGRIIRIPTRAITFMDELFKGLFGQMEAAAEAYRIAKGEGLAGEALEKRIAGLVNLPGSEAWQKAAERAREDTFQQDFNTETVGGKMADAVLKFRTAFPGMRYILPFVRILYNILGMGLRKSPLGLANVIQRFARDGLYHYDEGAFAARRYERPEMIRHVAEQVIAWTSMALLYGAAQGDEDDAKKRVLITGSQPFDPKSYGQRELADRTGTGAYTIKVGNHVFHYGRLEPLATVLGTTVDIMKMIKQSHRREQGALIASAVQSIAGQLTEKSFTKGIGDMYKLMSDPTGEGVNVASQFASSWVPNLLRQPLRGLDGYVRENSIQGGGKNFIERFVKKTAAQALPAPGLSEPKIDLYGNPETKGGAVAVPNRADQLLENWNARNPDAPYAPETPDRRLVFNHQPYFMNDEEFMKYSELAGANLSRLLSGVSLNVENPTERDIQVIKNATRASREMARRQLFPTSPIR